MLFLGIDCEYETFLLCRVPEIGCLQFKVFLVYSIKLDRVILSPYFVVSCPESLGFSVDREGASDDLVFTHKLYRIAVVIHLASYKVKIYFFLFCLLLNAGAY